jgi:hypothetical protein
VKIYFGQASAQLTHEGDGTADHHSVRLAGGVLNQQRADRFDFVACIQLEGE